MTPLARLALILLSSTLLGACASRVPTVAHTHVGHALSGWVDTPGERGLLAVAESEARIAVQHAEFAVAGGRDVAEVRLHLGHVLNTLDPAREPEGPGQGYGLIRALEGASKHVQFAGESTDASGNLRAGALVFARLAAPVLDEARLTATLADTARATSDPAETLVFADEVLTRSRHIRDGLAGLRRQIEDTTDREDPSYQPVERWYLFNLIRLPSGDWIFRDRNDSSTSRNSGGYL
ncbi:MAG: hypothetical protein KDH20_00660 [Rhodocyclaceae bacterium]|nr:hypothetical protein [Rhodocyclaceae bacterium]